ncbi:SlyX family protein [Luminiphilus sp.]|nr:SlyX family protein [Luminiphilus sp.]MDA7581767.1 SlyX family protein [Luminiphilus sp.]MDA8590607.1 SlyX family protein [Luminiphilus sp.]MDA8662871.1 SlyX family protein [Luminiphilus sp.]MDA8738465.1 SlyX family protein [Luminiphilus sp.]
MTSETAELETKIAFLEVANDELESALLMQHKRLESMEAAVGELRLRLKEQATLIEGLGDTESEPPPPHY